MKKSLFFLLALLTLTSLAARDARSGSAVAMDIQHGRTFSSVGYPVDVAKRRALEKARGRYGPNVRLLAATDVVGYGAIAVAAKGNSSIVGVALGRPSLQDAQHRAIDHCLKAGGINPKVIRTFKG